MILSSFTAFPLKGDNFPFSRKTNTNLLCKYALLFLFLLSYSSHFSLDYITDIGVVEAFIYGMEKESC